MRNDVLKLAIPSILANITIPLVGIVDVAIIGHLSNAAAIGGIAVGTTLFDLLYWNFGFLRVSTAGETRHDTAPEVLIRAITIAALSALLCLVLQWVFVTGVLALMPCSDEVAAFARQYFFVRIWAAPATLILMAMKGWFIGMKDTVSPMITDIVVNGINMVASYLLAVYLLGPIGVAWGTLLAQYAGLLTAAILWFVRYRHLLPAMHVRAALRRQEMRRLMRMNSNYIVRSLCMMVVYVGYTTLASAYGDTELAVSAILMKLFLLFSYITDGFAYAAEALKPLRNERDGAIVKDLRLTRELLLWALGIGTLVSLVYGVFANQMVGLMTSELTVRAAASPYFIWLWLMPLISSLAFLWDGVFVGASDSISVRNCMIASAIGFVLTYLALYSFWDIQALYAAYFAHLLIRTLYLTIRWTHIN